MTKESQEFQLPQVVVEQDFISLNEIFWILFRYKWSIITLTVLATVLAAFISLSIQPLYRAEALLELDAGKNKVVSSIEEVYGGNDGKSDFIKTQIEIIKSRLVLERIVEQFGLTDDPEFNPYLRSEPAVYRFLNWRKWFGIRQPAHAEYKSENRDTLSALLKRINVATVGMTRVVKISVESTKPEQAADLANAVAHSYIAEQINSKTQVTKNAGSWMQNQLYALSEKLNQSEIKLQQFREKEDLVDLAGVLTIASDELRGLTRSLMELRRKLSESGNIYQQAKSGTIRNPMDYQSLPLVLKDPLIRELRQEQARLQRQVMELSRRYGPKHPGMISATTELESIGKNIKDQILNVINSTKRDYEIDKANEKALQRAVNKSRERVKTINNKQFMLRSLERELQTNKDLYQAFYKRIQEIDATNNLQESGARIVDKAFVPGSPVKPDKLLIVVIASILAFIFSCTTAFALEMLNDTIRTEEDVQRKLGAVLLAVLPLLDKKSKKQRLYTLYLEHEHHAFKEVIRTLRTGINLTFIDNKSKLIAISSTAPAEGKSCIAINLALSLGQLGRTLIIDCDLRRPTFDVALGFEKGAPGLTNLLAGSGSKNSCIQHYKLIDVLVAGQQTAIPQELLASNGFAELLEKFREDYEYIIIDLPPATMFSDAIIVGNLCDGLIFAVESGKVRRKNVKSALDTLNRSKINLAGVVLNKADVKREGYYGDLYDYDKYQTR